MFKHAQLLQSSLFAGLESDLDSAHAISKIQDGIESDIKYGISQDHILKDRIHLGRSILIQNVPKMTHGPERVQDCMCRYNFAT